MIIDGFDQANLDGMGMSSFVPMIGRYPAALLDQLQRLGDGDLTVLSAKARISAWSPAA